MILNREYPTPVDPDFATDLPASTLMDGDEEFGCAHRPVPRVEPPWARCRRCGAWGRVHPVGDWVAVDWEDEDR